MTEFRLDWAVGNLVLLISETCAVDRPTAAGILAKGLADPETIEKHLIAARRGAAVLVDSVGDQSGAASVDTTQEKG